MNSVTSERVVRFPNRSSICAEREKNGKRDRAEEPRRARARETHEPKANHLRHDFFHIFFFSFVFLLCRELFPRIATVLMPFHIDGRNQQRSISSSLPSSRRRRRRRSPPNPAPANRERDFQSSLRSAQHFFLINLFRGYRTDSSLL